jgi:hypothetical protein
LGAGTDAQINKNLAHFDASMRDAYVGVLNDYFKLDAELLCWYNSGVVPLGSPGSVLYATFTAPTDTTTAAIAAQRQVMAAPKPGYGRNVVALGVPLDPRGVWGVYPPYSGALPDINSTEGSFYLHQCPADIAGAHTVTVSMTNSSTDASFGFDLYVNEARVKTISIPANTTTPTNYTASVTLRAGNNSFQLRKTMFTGSFLSVHSITYT